MRSKPLQIGFVVTIAAVLGVLLTAALALASGPEAARRPPALNAGGPVFDDGSAQTKTAMSALTVNAVFSGTYNVGAGEAFTSLTNPGGIFDAINAGTLSGNVIINITSDLTGELGTHALNEWAEAGAGGYSLLIRPSGAPHTITGSINGALIRLNGADRVTLDGSLGGGNDRSLTIQNTNPGTLAMVIALPSGANGAQNNTLKNLNVLGQDADTTLAGIALSGAPPISPFALLYGDANHGNRVQNCAVGQARWGIFSAGSNTGTVITQNEVGVVSPNSEGISRKGIVVLNASGVQITQNIVMVYGQTNCTCVRVAIGVGAYAWNAWGATDSGSTANALVSRNHVFVSDLSSNPLSAVGIGGSGTNTIVNNYVSNVQGSSAGANGNTEAIVAGIAVDGSAVKIYNNSVGSVGGQRFYAESNGYGIVIFHGTAAALKNNYIARPASSQSRAHARSYSVGVYAYSVGVYDFANLDSDYNHYLGAPTFRVGQLDTGYYNPDGVWTYPPGTDYDGLASWQAAVSQDAHSFAVVPGYSSFIAPDATGIPNFHLRTGYPLPYVGTPLAEVTEDFDGEPRVAPYDIGPDQVWIDVAVAKTASPALLSPGAAVTYTLAFSSLINAGPSVATGAVISDRVPLSVTITGVTSSTFGSGVRITQTSGGPLPSTGADFAWALITNTATIAASDDLTPTNNSSSAALTVPRLLVYPAQPGVAPNGSVTISATVTPALAGLTVSFTVASGGGGLSSPSATTDAGGVATVLYTAGALAGQVQIDGMLAAAPDVRDRGIVYVAAAPTAGGLETSASGVYTAGNLSPNFIQVVKTGAGTPILGWAEFGSNPCPDAAPGSRVVSPYVDVMAVEVTGVDAIVVTLRYVDTASAAQHKLYWCDLGVWQPVTETVRVDTVQQTLVFTVTGSTTPGLFQLAGTPFVGVGLAPTAATVGDFVAAGQGDRVSLTWQTLNEIGLAGFHLYRGLDPAGPGDRITGAPVAAQGAGGLQGFAYGYADFTPLPAETPVYYWLEELHGDGAYRHGPLRVGNAGSVRIFLPAVHSR